MLLYILAAALSMPADAFQPALRATGSARVGLFVGARRCQPLALVASLSGLFPLLSKLRAAAHLDCTSPRVLLQYC